MNPILAYDNSLWLVEPQQFQRIAARVLKYQTCFSAKEVAKHRRKMLDMAAALADGAIDAGGLDMPIEAEAPRAIRSVKGKIGVIPIAGPIDQHESSELMKSGGTSVDFITAAFDSLMGNASIGAIVLHLDSPGGNVYGIQELSDKIYKARGPKPIYAIADSMAASAAYWIASAADMVISTPGGDVGSVGVYVMHVDQSAALEKEGFKVSLVQAGKHKTEFSPFGPLSDDARAEAQSRVDGIYDKFLGALSRNMDKPIGAVRDGFGQGRVLGSEKALAAGMIHRVMTFQELIGKLVGSSPSAAKGPSAEVLRARHERVKREAEKKYFKTA